MINSSEFSLGDGDGEFPRGDVDGEFPRGDGELVRV